MDDAGEMAAKHIVVAGRQGCHGSFRRLSWVLPLSVDGRGGGQDVRVRGFLFDFRQVPDEEGRVAG
jgi:hypothetical protein